MKAGQTPTDHSGAVQSHYIGAAGEHLVAAYFLSQGWPVYFPIAQAGWADLMVQTPHGAKRVQVKASETGDASVRVRSLGASGVLTPSDRYDLLAVVHTHRLWLIPSSTLGDRDTITLKPHNHDCQFAQFRKR